MRSPREQAKEFSRRADDCEKRAELERDQSQKQIIRALAAYYRQMAKRCDPYLGITDQ
jgi:hypothetical protein